MESFADLVAAVAKPLDQFAQENVTAEPGARLAGRTVSRATSRWSQDGGEYRLAPLAAGGAGDEEPPSPAWLADFGQEGDELSAELLEESCSRRRASGSRGSGCRRCRRWCCSACTGSWSRTARSARGCASAPPPPTARRSSMRSPTIPDRRRRPGAARGSRTFAAPITKVSTVGVNVQSDSELKAELFGDVKINFGSETLPLDRFVDEAKRTLLERHAPHAADRAARAAADAAPRRRRRPARPPRRAGTRRPAPRPAAGRPEATP